MPTYEYRCPKGHGFEHFFRTISAAESRMKCPECGEIAERIMSGGAGLLFKGTGFYITDYGKDGKKDQRSGANESAASLSSAKSETKAESKSAAAPAPSSPSAGSSGGGSSTKGDS